MLLTFYLLPLLAGLLESASSPTFVNNPIDPSLTASSVNVQNHWSEAITLPRPDLSKTDFNNSQRLNCPYSAQGLKRWSDPSIWPNSAVPIADTGTAISLPVGVSVLVAAGDLSSSVYGYITIPVGSKLIFADADITLSTLGMIVQGSLAIGAETCPLSSKVKIILYGSKPNSLPVSPSVKGIHVTGRLDIHGVIYAPTWTRLARTAEAGDTLIYLQDLVNWEPGQTVMITTTEYKDSLDFNHNDVATIDTVYSAPHLGPKVSVIKLTSALKYRHYADTEYQAEVAMLSRRIVIMGDDSSEDSTSTAAGCLDDNSKSTHPCGFISGYGGHVMIDTTGIGRVTGVEFYHMGQTNVMARYPFHFHMLGVYGNTSAIRYSSIRESFYRAVAVHGSNSTLVSNNVAFNITGNAYYIEDGVEEDSLFEFNLGAFVHVLQFTNQASFWLQQMDFVVASPTLLVPTDLTASPFYITNPANKFIGNAASGGWSGFAFPGLPKPIQLHRNVLMNPPPFSRMLPQFEGNSAHSTGHWWNNGGGIYVGGLFEHDPNDPNGVLHYNPGRISTIIRDPCNGLIGPYGCTNPAWLRFNNTKVFLANRGIMGWGPRIEVVKYEGHDCGKSANALGQVWVDKMLAICRTRNVPQFLNGCQSPFWYQCSARDVYNWQGFVGFEWYDVGQMHILTNITFRNCDGHMGNCIGGDCNSAPWSFVTHSDTFIPENMQATRGVVYQNCDPTRLYKFGARPVPYSVSGRLQNWRDIDGSASMRYVPTQMGSTWALDWWKLGNDSCVRGPKEMDMWECDYPTTTASMLFQTDFAQFAQVGNTLCGNGNQISCPTLGYINHIYRSDLLSGLIMTPNPKVTGMADDTLGGGWYIRWYAGAPKSLTITNIQLMKANGLPGATLLVAIPYPPGTTFTVTGKAADWCYAWQGNLCTHPYQPMSSLAALRALTSADGYFWDSNINVLYVSVVQQKYDGLGPGVWDPFRAPDMFVRDGITLVGISGFRIVIEASCTVSQSNAAFCALDNSDFNVVRTAIGAPVFTRSRSSAPLSSSLAPSISAAPSTAIPSSSPPPSKAPSTVVPSSSPIPTNAPSTALPSSSPIPSKAPSTAVPSSSPMPTKAPSTPIPSSSPIPSVSRAPSTVAPSSIPVSTASTSASSAPISSSPPSSLAPSSLSNSKASSSAQPVLSVSSASTQTPSAQPTAPTKASSASSPSPSAIIQTAISTATWASTAHTAVYRFSFTTAPKSSPTSTRSSQLSKKALLLSNSTESLPWPTSSLPVPGPSSSGSYSSGQASVQDSSSSWVNTLSSSNIGISAVVVVAAAIAAGVYMMFRRRQQRKLKAQPLQLRVSAQL